MVDVVITGIGLVTPLGSEPRGVMDRVLRRESAARPAPFSPPIACRLFAPVSDFVAQTHFSDNKTLRLMNRDAQMAVVAAQRAMQDAGIIPGVSYPPEQIALYGATGLSGMPAEEISRLVRFAAAADGSLDLQSFGREALRRIRPVLSFKILANMPICFVSIFQNIRGPNAVYTPWEGNGAQAIAAGIRAIRNGEVPCALVGGCDVKTRVLSLVTLQQMGVFDSWTRHGQGCIPGEGAVFLFLENRQHAARRRARIYAAVRNFVLRPVPSDVQPADVFKEITECVDPGKRARVVAGGDGDVNVSQAEQRALEWAGLNTAERIHPKACLGNLFAAAAAVQVALAAEWVSRSAIPPSMLVNCFGWGAEQAAFVLESA